MENIWALLSQLRAQVVHLVFIFSHTADDGEEGPPSSPVWYNTVVDKMSTSARSPHISPGLLQWVQDALRPLQRDAVLAADARPDVNATFQYKHTQSATPLRIDNLRLLRTQQHLLLQLRAGACRQLPGWRPEIPEPCPWCGCLVGRRTASFPARGRLGTTRNFSRAEDDEPTDRQALAGEDTRPGGRAVHIAVEHVFCCPQCTPPFPSSVDALFSDSPSQALAHVNFYLKGPS